MVPGAAARRSTSGCCGWPPSPPSPCSSASGPGRRRSPSGPIVTYDLFLSTTNFHNNRAYLVIVLAALAVTPCDRELSLDAWLARRRGGRPARRRRRRGRCGCCGSRPRPSTARPGLSKLLDPDWFSGTVTWHRLNRTRDQLEASVLPPWAIDVLTDRIVQHLRRQVRHRHRAVHRPRAVVPAAPATRRCGSPSASTSRSSSSARVEVFSYLAIAALVIWAVPSTRDRTLRIDVARHRSLARRACGRSTGWPASASSRRPPAARSPSSSGTARRSPVGRAVALDPQPAARHWPGSPCRADRRRTTSPDRRRTPMTASARRRAPAARRRRSRVARRRSRSASPRRPSTARSRRRRRCARPPTTPCSGSCATSSADGRWLYQYDAARQDAPDDYNLVRHAGAIMGLYQAATAGIDGALASADRGLGVGAGQPRRARRMDGARRRTAGRRSAARRCSPPGSPSAGC